MKRTSQTHTFFPTLSILTTALLLATFSTASANDVCSQGTGIPPFLAGGAAPNMLLVLDNSGSMLDMAYQNKIDGDFCFDDSYLADEATPGNISLARKYNGNFDIDTWYVWTDVAPSGSVTAWTANTCYTQGEVVLNNSKLWTAVCSTPNCDSNSDGSDDGCESAGNNVFDDNDNGGLVWADYFAFPDWEKGTVYSLDDIVQYQQQLYICQSPGASNVTPPNDAGVGKKWLAIDYTWMPNTVYSQGDIVTYKGMIFEANTNYTSSATGLFDDRLGNPSGALIWDRIDEGYFAEFTPTTNSPTPCTDTAGGVSPSYVYTPVDSVDSSSRIDVAVTMVDTGGNKITNAETQTPVKVTCFGALGNFLNWASASKFDIQKKILTGGKYHAGYEVQDASGVVDHTTSPQTDTGDDRLISEHRGCAGKGFTKQVPLDSTNDIKLTLRTRGSTEEDWIDTTDDTTRIEILAVTPGGFDNSDCQAVVDAIEAGASFNSISNLINSCLSSGTTDERAALNHGLQYCEKLRDGSARDINTIVGDCEALFNDATTPVSPATIDPRNGAYACYGVFDDNTAHDDREGYMGRCWTVASNLTCEQTPCPNSDPLPNYFELGSGNSAVGYMCAADGFLYSCGGNFNANQKTCNQAWTAEYTDLTPGDLTDGPCPPTSATAGWSDDYDGIPGSDGTLSGNCHDGTFAEGAECGCLGEALYDYCKALSIPEVIDPSDIASSSLDFLGLPGNLVDSGVASQLGEAPLAVFKGYIQYSLPDGSDPDEDDQHNDRVERPDGPRGIFHQVASSLRIGAMAFNGNGSKAECDILTSTCTKNTNGVQFDACLDNAGVFDGTLLNDDTSDCYYCSIREPILKFCPDSNSDGANVVADIKPVLDVDDNILLGDPSDDIEIWDHYTDLVNAVNDVRATSWTPLAESLYNAFGYYGQRADRCLTTDGSGNCLDFTVDPTIDPVQYWCQDNHILILTEGASTADINTVVANFATTNGDIDTDIGGCSSGLDGSTYLDDMTYYGLNASASELFATPQIDSKDKKKITTHIITTGSLTSGTDECSPLKLMTDAAANGGTNLYAGENPDTLEANLESVMSDILSRASAGSAASVISSSRSGSGAVYQAIFWPELTGQVVDNTTTPPTIDEYKIAWVGDVHALFLDSNGFLFEDTNHDGVLNPSTDLNHNGILDAGEIDEDGDNNPDGDDYRLIFYYSEVANRSRACLNITDFYAGGLICPDDPDPLVTKCEAPDYTSAPVDLGDHCRELPDIDYLWSASQWLSDINVAASGTEDTNRSAYLPSTGFENKRYIFTWQDLNNNGMVDHFPDVAEDEQRAFTVADLVPSTPLDVTPDSNTDVYFGANSVRGSVVDDFAITTADDVKKFVAGGISKKDDAVKSLINWVRGVDQLTNEDVDGEDDIDAGEDLNGNGRVEKNLRSRDFPFTDSSGTTLKTWRLGDVIHSTPTVVARPAEAYHFIYKDQSYAIFADKYANRRQVVYFGANDGMLHAINAGFYEEGTNKFWKGYKTKTEYITDINDTDPNNDTYFKDVGPDLGTELWSYIPYNLIPHLKCMADPDYNHKYFVDQRPRIVDVQIFPDDCVYNGTAIDCTNAKHPGGWGTILIGSLRFGGAEIHAHDINGNSADERTFTSAYFILDITDPDQEPELLGEMTMVTDVDNSGNNETTDLGYSTPSPTIVVMREDTGATNWYLIMGNGPERLDGTNQQRGKISILPLEWLLGRTTGWQWNDLTTKKVWSPRSLDTSWRRPFRIPDKQPGSGSTHHVGQYQGEDIEGGTYHLPDAQASFVSDLITVDFDIETQGSGTLGGFYRSDAVYFGTVDGTNFAGPADNTYWDGSGRLFRMVTKYIDNSGNEQASKPNQWNDGPTSGGKYLDGSAMDQWYNPHNLLIDAESPIVAAPSAGWDGSSFWVYFGTGRFFDKDDKTDTQTNRFYGIREPFRLDSGLECDDYRLAWTPLKAHDGTLWDVTWHDMVDLRPGDITDTASPPANPPGSRGLLQTDNIMVSEYATAIYDVPFLECGHCVEDLTDPEGISCTALTASDCFPAALPQVTVPDPTTADPTDTTNVYTFFDLNKYIAGTSCDSGIDGWVREIHEPRERHVGQSALLGGLLTYTGYQPFSDVCKAEGRSFLYGIHYQTGTAWYESVFGTYVEGTNKYVKEKLSLGRGLASTPSLHVGSGDNAATAFIQTSTGEIIEIGQENLPLKNVKSGRASWSDETN